MNKQKDDRVGIKLEPFTYKVERCKVRELLCALDNHQSVDATDEYIPPTFPTVIEFWGSQTSVSMTLGLKIEKVLHGGQEYKYRGKIRIGDDITVYGEVEDVYTKAAMTFVVIKKEFVNQHGETVVVGRSTIIERQ
ncbi:MaoC family dehydratase N-terminal domain-containing protein [Brevibacillus porteri]|uniref:FAS1-like dehydratase domain-containing protein n=1 Tax=Brevibacillus porteri TaxID=2126350 RepID=UPI00370C4180